MPTAASTTMEEIPSITKELLFAHAPYDVWWKLATRLDPDSTVSGNDWRLMASKCGFDNTQIVHINSLQRNHGSNTIKVFEKLCTERQEMTVYEMLAIFNDMERADVFEILKDSVTEIKKQKENRSSLNHLPSGQQHTEACTCHSGQFPRPACEDGIPIPPKRKKHRGSSPPDQLGVVSSSVDSDGDVMMDSLGNDVSVERKTRVLVTYTDDNEKHLKHMISLAKCLKDNQFAVIMDINKRENDELYDDMCGKIDKYFEKANYILICISPKYRQEMEEVDDEDDQFLSGSTVCHRLNTRYIYKLMQGEFRNNNSQNKRFIPVLFPNATKHDIPGWLLNTLYYRWPNEWMDLFMFLWRPDREFLDSKISSVKSKYDQDESLQSVPLSPQSTSRSGSQSSSCSSPGSAGRLPRIKKENT